MATVYSEECFGSLFIATERIVKSCCQDLGCSPYTVYKIFVFVRQTVKTLTGCYRSSVLFCRRIVVFSHIPPHYAFCMPIFSTKCVFFFFSD